MIRFNSTRLVSSGLAGTVALGVAFAPVLTHGSSERDTSTARADSSTVDLGSRLELMAGTKVIDQLKGQARLQMNPPTRREVVMKTNKPWEGNASHYRQIFRDGGIYRMYYGGDNYDSQSPLTLTHPSVIAYAESTDGIHWKRPKLRLVSFNGSKANNIVKGLFDPGAYVFKDANPGARRDAKYKAIAPRGKGLYLYKSADGLTFTPLGTEPIMTWGPDSKQGLTSQAFDSLNVVFWDEVNKTYRMYLRYYINRKASSGTFRGILTSTSSDLVNWSKPEELNYSGSKFPETSLYTNNVQPYYRAPGTLVGFPMRYNEPPSWLESHYSLPGLDDRINRLRLLERLGTVSTDSLFMSSRDGVNFNRFDEAYIRPTAGTNNWAYGDQSLGRGLIETHSDVEGAPNELSMYATEGYWTGPDLDVVRYSTRIDGFASVNAPRDGGEMLTKPLNFDGSELAFNFASSAAGSIKVEIEDAKTGQPLPGYSLKDSDAMFGNDLARAATWHGSADLSKLANQTVRLRVVMSDADLYSLQFREASTFANAKRLVAGFRSSGDIEGPERQALTADLSQAMAASDAKLWSDARQAMQHFLTRVQALSSDKARNDLSAIGNELLRKTSRNALTLPTRYGWLENDTDPKTGNLGNVGLSTALFALDYHHRSIGAALWEPAKISKLVLRDVDSTTRLTPTDLQVYVSDTNDGDWQLVPGVRVTRVSNGFELSGINRTTRFVKVVQPYGDTAFTFSNKISTMLEVVPAP